MPDHFEDQLAVAPALAVAANATSTLRMGALVFGNDYRHPVVLAKDMATLDVLSDGRMEFGIGAGWMRTDYEAAGMSYDRPGERIDRMLESIEIIRGLFGDGPVDFAGEHYTITGLEGLPKPVQSPPPLLIGGGGKRMLTIAAEQADIVGVTANLKAGEIGADAVADITPARFDEKLQWVRDAAGDRMNDIELNCLVMSTQVVADREAAITGTAAMFGFDRADADATPILLIGSPDEIVGPTRGTPRPVGIQLCHHPGTRHRRRARARRGPAGGQLAEQTLAAQEPLGAFADVGTIVVVERVVVGQHDAPLHDAVGVGQPVVGLAQGLIAKGRLAGRVAGPHHAGVDPVALHPLLEGRAADARVLPDDRTGTCASRSRSRR